MDCVTKPVDGLEGGLCSKCGAIKPLAEFKRKLSLLQSRAMGYAGNFPLEVTSKYCRSCQPVTKSLRAMPKHQLAALHAEGVITDAMYQNVLASRARSAAGKHAAATAKRAENARREAWTELIKDVNREITVVTQQAKFAGYANDKFRLAYTTLYKRILTTVREELKVQRDMTSNKTEGLEDWRQLVSVDEVRALLDVWRDIPSRTKEKMRMGQLITPEWRTHCGATNMTDAMRAGRATYRKRVELMEEVRAATQARVEREEAERQAEPLMTDEELLAAIREDSIEDGETTGTPIQPAPKPQAPRLLTKAEQEAKDVDVSALTDELLSDLGLNK